MRRETQALHAGYNPGDHAHAVAAPIYATVAYEFDNAAQGAALFNLEEAGFRYSRINNPTNHILDERVNALEGGVGALCVASGQAALHYALLNVSSPGDNIVSVPQLYGTTHTLFTTYFPQMGVQVRFAASDAPADIERLIDARTCAVFCEAVGNPAGNICDIEAVARVAHTHQAPLVVDNTVPTPMMLRPIEHGADIVVASLTKYMGGHGAVLGGAIIDSGNFAWSEYGVKYRMFTEADQSYHGLVYADYFGRRAYIERCRSFCQRVTGAVLSPFNAFLLLQGIETLPLRMERHVKNARAVAEALVKHPKVAWVNYPGFADNRYYPLAVKYFGGDACALMSFGVQGGYEAGVRVYDALRLVRRCVNLGDAKTLACHPASTTHRQMPPDVQRKAGVLPETIRISVGLEHVADILEDLTQALEQT